MKSTQDIILNFSKQVKQLLGMKLTKVILYGSYARGDNRDNSDIDISVIVKNEEHFNYWLGALPFYDNVQKEGIVLNG